MEGLGTLLLIILLLSACHASDQQKAPERWYSSEQLSLGERVFSKHCAACHGPVAEGLAADWKKRQADGSLPPPPLNGTAHAWHHSTPLLLQIIQQGGALYDGKMPGFSGSLSEAEQYAVIAWFQSLWDDDIYNAWQTGNIAAGLPAPVQRDSDD